MTMHELQKKLKDNQKMYLFNECGQFLWEMTNKTQGHEQDYTIKKVVNTNTDNTILHVILSF